MKKHGLNELPKPKPLSQVEIFFSQFNNALVYILLIAGGFSLILKSYVDAGVIFGAVFLNIIIGFFQENKANQAIAKLRQLVEHKALVIRGGREMIIDSPLLTVGDIIILQPGNRVPADGRLVECVDLAVNESGLSGESMPAQKALGEEPPGAALADRKNMVYAGTTILSGQGRAVVTAVGNQTEIGRIAEMVNEAKEEKTPLQLRLGRFSRQLGMMFAVICAVIVLIGVAQGRSFLVMVNTGVAVAVAAIPEGLTIAVTVILALGMQQILKEKALTRKLVAAETLGSTTVICTDKTGTLTEGKMHVSHIVIGEKEFNLAAVGKKHEEEALGLNLALQASLLCNDAFIENPRDELAIWRIAGSPTDAALLSAAVQAGLRREELLKIEPKIAELPFQSDRKFMITIHDRTSRDYIMYEKGAPEKILAKCVKYHEDGEIAVLSAPVRLRLGATYEKLTGSGLRVVAVASRIIKKEGNFKNLSSGTVAWPEVDQNLTFIGFMAIKDPLRPEAKETIRLARQAGIRTVVITGDHKLTAKAIAAEVGLKVKTDNILLGDELDRMSDERLKKIVKNIDIYARVSPHHKLRIVKAWQERGEVVAMTGDGINDSPALKAADIGISLGTGSDIAKETSDIVLLDNNFKTIVSAVRQGRVIFKNIRKVVTFLLSDGFSEMTLVIGSLFFNLPLAILPAQILWINIVNDGLPNYSLAKETGGDNVMEEKPIKKSEPILNCQMKYIIFGAGLFRDLALFGVFLYLYRIGQDITYLRTLMFACLGVKSLMSIFSLRAFRRPIWRLNPWRNRYLNSAVAISLLFLSIGIYSPPFQSILSTVNLKPSAWLLALAFGALSIALIESIKYYFARSNRPHESN
ncbi:MAG: cation-translocating P-type ATPase [Planctomycetes bacterium]|nr:cation-translocating P-type ATPase [Planctomycetota bacterium]